MQGSRWSTTVRPLTSSSFLKRLRFCLLRCDSCSEYWLSLLDDVERFRDLRIVGEWR